MSDPVVLSASGPTVGKVCPRCDQPLASGDAYVSCQSCLCPQHAACWQAHGESCGSYFCAKETRRAAEDLGPAKIVISMAEVDAPQDTSPRAPTSFRRAAGAALPQRIDPVATTALILGVFSIVFLGFFVGPAAIIVAAVSIGRIGASGQLTGRGRAAAGLILGVAGAALWTGGALLFVTWRQGPNGHGGPGQSPFLADAEAPLPPPAEQLDLVPGPIRAALRSNVFIIGSRGFPRPASWVGSGIVVDATATHMRILTNRHVADGDLDGSDAANLEVQTIHGTKVPARVLWRAEGGIDVALIEAALTGADRLLDVATLAPVLPSFGTRVFAVGNPQALGWSYTEGVVSSLRRHDQGGRNVTFIQTQTPINPGNSGGGLYDMEGRLVGMNSWKIDDSVGEGLSFAIAALTIVELREGIVRAGIASVSSAVEAPPPGGRK